MSDNPIVDAASALEPSKTEFIIAGDSHIFALGASQDYAGPVSLIPIDAASSRGSFLMARWQGGRGAPYWDALVPHSKDRSVVLSVMGNQHFAHFLLARTPLFDFVDPKDPGDALHSGAVVVPRRMVKALPMLNTNWLRDLIQRLQTGGCRDIIIIGTPPVREDFGDAYEHVSRTPFWRQRAASMGVDIATCGFTPAPIMKRLWGVLQESLCDVARETGARFLPVPNEVIDVNGYRAAGYAGPLWNFAHANEAYGRLILEHVIRALSEDTTESQPPGDRV
jgi:hypothetical protein